LKKTYTFGFEDVRKVRDSGKITALGYVKYHNVAGFRWETRFAMMLEVDKDWKLTACYPMSGIVGPIDRRIG
jgi:hypothetical protein